MTATSRKGRSDVDVSFLVDDETLQQLQSLGGQRIVRAVVWEESVADALGGGELTEAAADIDVYLSDGIFFELYGVLCYPDLESDPLADISSIRQHIAAPTASGLWLEEVAVDTEDDLVLVLTNRDSPVLFLNAGAWALGEWEELPDVD